MAGCSPEIHISVLIPTFNGMGTVEGLFSAIQEQSLQPLEVIVCDSGSEDGTVQCARSYGYEVIEIPNQEFDHGGTRSMLAERARGDILVYFTQDAIPAGPGSLEKLVGVFLRDDQICCSYGRQLPAKGATESAISLRDFNYPPQSEIRSFADRQRLGLKTIFVSNSFAAYRRNALKEVGYFKNGLIFGEDTCTLGRLLQAGGKVAYIAEATVFHSHNYTLLEEFRRSFDNGVFHHMESWLCETYGGAQKIGLAFLQRQLELYLREGQFGNAWRFFWRTGIRFGGYRLGQWYTYLPRNILPFLSMNRSWWKKQHRYV